MTSTLSLSLPSIILSSVSSGPVIFFVETQKVGKKFYLEKPCFTPGQNRGLSSGNFGRHGLKLLKLIHVIATYGS